MWVGQVGRVRMHSAKQTRCTMVGLPDDDAGVRKGACMLLQMADESGLQYDRLRALDSPALRAGNWSQLCVTCKARAPCVHWPPVLKVLPMWIRCMSW